MASFPLVLAIEPRLLPFARLNGFCMDRKAGPRLLLREHADANRPTRAM